MSSFQGQVTRSPFFQGTSIGLTQPTADYSPEVQAELSRAERRRQLANLLLQQGLMGGPSATQVGRFTVPRGWAQNLGDLGKVAMGAYGNIAADEAGRKAIADETTAREKVIEAFQKQIAPTPAQPERFLGSQEEAGGESMPVMPASRERVQQAILDVQAKNRDPYLQRLMQQHQAVLDASVARKAEFDATIAQRGEQRTQEAALKREQMAMEERIAKLAADTKRETATATHEQTKPPSGYRLTKEGSLEPIPGGPADTKIQGAMNADTARLEASTNNLDRLAMEANKLLKHPGLDRITGVVGAFPNIPGTAAADAQAILDAMKSQVGFSVLQQMRDNAKTGGALGQVSDKENKLLQDNLAALSEAQSTTQMKTSLEQIIEYVNGAKDRLRNAYNIKYSDKTSAAPSKASATSSGLTKAEQDELNTLRKRFGK